MAADGPGTLVAAAEPSLKRGGNARSRRSDRRADPRVVLVRLQIVAKAIGTGPATSFRMPLNARFPIGICGETKGI
jgi:hypothetical protein